MRLAFILGTRPEIIKTAPLIFEAQKTGVDFSLIHTGQHYDAGMDAGFFEEFSLPKPDVRLSAGGRPYAEQLAYLMREIGAALNDLEPDAVVLQGDTVTVMAGALAARKLEIPIVHHEAGLRSRDPRMSEEYHRIITDHLSDLLCAPTADAVKNLLEEGVPADRVHLTGNTIVDAVRRFSAEARAKSDILDRLSLSPKSYFVLTLHRAENVDERGRLAACVESLERVCREHPDRPIIFPVHPRVERRLAEHGLAWPAGARTIKPIGYLDMLKLIGSADVVMTDSGGLQEESALLGAPCVTLRDSTERPETVAAGVNIVAGLGQEGVSAAVRAMRSKKIEPLAAYGDGRTAPRILRLIEARVLRRQETLNAVA